MKTGLYRVLTGICMFLDFCVFCVSLLLAQEEPENFREWTEFWKGEVERIKEKRSCQ